MSRHSELTPNQVARMLGISRPFLAELLDEGVIPSRRVRGRRQRRVRSDDVLAFRRLRDETRQHINEIVDAARADGISY